MERSDRSCDCVGRCDGSIMESEGIMGWGWVCSYGAEYAIAILNLERDGRCVKFVRVDIRAVIVC